MNYQDELTQKIKDFKKENPELRKEIRIAKLQERLITLEYLRMMIVGLIKETEDKLSRLNKPQSKSNNGTITDDMIARAKDYPIGDLVELNNYGKAYCPFHEEKTPSFSVKNNRYNCFGCGEKGDVIDFIMKREGINFIEAVKRLK